MSEENEKLEKENEPEKVEPKEEKTVLEIIDDAESPEQLEAARTLLLETPSETAPKEDKPGEKVDKEQEPKEKEGKKLIEITDEYIESADEDKKKILGSIKGETLSEKALKNYLESQKLIGKKSTEIFELKSEHERQPREITIDDEQRTIIAGAVKKRLRQENPDIPQDPEEYKEYILELQNTDPDKAQELYDRRRELTENFTEDYKTMVYVKENYDVINYNTMKKEVDFINNIFENKIGFKPEDIGLDLTVDKEFSNDVINNILVDDKGEFDSKLVTYYDQKNRQTPILNEGEFAKKFLLENIDKILLEVAKRARKEGFESRDKKKVVKELTDISTEKPGEVKTETLHIDDIENIDDLERIRKYREQVGDMIGSE